MRTDRILRMVHGLRVGSAVEIEGVDLTCTDGSKRDSSLDLNIAVVDDVSNAAPIAEEILAYHYDNGWAVRSVRALDSSVLVSFSDVGRFRISADRRLIEFAAGQSENAALAQVLLQGWVMSMTLMLRGYTVLHASAVEVDHRAIALLADSGMGKSTVAAMLVRDGAKLLTDDVLRVEQVGDEWLAHPGITALRLRPAAASLAQSIAGAAVSTTPDNRLSVRVKRSDAAPATLAAIVVPFPSRSSSRVEIQWLDTAQAVVELNRYPRVYDWKIDEPIRRHFQATCDLAARVPVGLMSVPWGPPWPANLLDSVIELLPTDTGWDVQSLV